MKNFCSCFKRNADSEIEDLVVSTQYQSFMDQISSDEESSQDELEFSDLDIDNNMEIDMNESDDEMLW